ncbi:glutathione S-transferase family protein [Aquibium carbonis]|uniref:Glutathione S-transferase family protein n=1 Tax=Aquibium carbonis TaxID=2495581 RepID=A0A3R9YES5_9HYPH|nr:glutathione S-transferase family protein [Aquibium carbonis]RST85952.1 glutathione S-transferase family protein [Aquibium carbonis]
MYELIIANKNYSSWSLRPWVLMRTLGIPFAETLVPFPSGDSFATYKPLSPNGRVPCLVDRDLRVWDSLAIVEYLAERHPGVWPADAVARAFARSAAAEMHSSFGTLRDICTMNCGLRIRLHERPAALERDIARIAEIWTEGLARFGGPFLAGAAFTAVDAFYAPVAFRAQTYGLSFGSEADAYAARLLALPAMYEWYEAALAEPFREEGHEAEARAVGEWTRDFRAEA